MTGVEPVRCHHRQILSLVRLPIPPHRHVETNENDYIVSQAVCQAQKYESDCLFIVSSLQ